MRKYFLIIISLLFVVFLFPTNADIFSTYEFDDDRNSYISDRQKADIESIFDIADSHKTTLPEFQNTLPSPHYRHIASQKKTQQHLINHILLKRFSSETRPTKKYNNKFSFPLSSKEDLIVIVRHLII